GNATTADLKLPRPGPAGTPSEGMRNPTKTTTIDDSTEPNGGRKPRRRGQALTSEEKKLYQKIIRIAKRLKLPHRAPGNVAKIAEKASTAEETVQRALKWGRKHKLI